MLAAGAVAQAFKELLIDFARESNIKVEVHLRPGRRAADAAQERRPARHGRAVRGGDRGAGERRHARPGSRAELGRGTAGVAVRAGAPVPDIATPEAVKQTMLAARSIAYPDPAGGGTAGVYFAGLMERFGIAEEVKKKALLQNRGYEIAAAVADGSADIGVTFISELLPNKDLKVVGPFPPAIGLVVPYVAGVLAAQQAGDRRRAP